jgi:hypothetical protein
MHANVRLCTKFILSFGTATSESVSNTYFCSGISLLQVLDLHRHCSGLVLTALCLPFEVRSYIGILVMCTT